MATVNYPTLVATRYVAPGAYIGQLITPAPSVTPDTRLPCYVGAGSRFAIASNRTVRRAFLFDQSLTFGPSAPFVANLPFIAVNDKALARIVDSNGNEVKPNQWQFVKNLSTLKYDQVQISSEVYDPSVTYTISYQSADPNVKDEFPVADIREFQAVGDGPDANNYDEYVNFFADFTVTGGDLSDPLALAADPDNTNTASSVSSITKTGVGASTGTVTFSGGSAFNHDYNRYYRLKCLTSSGVSPNRLATFEWTAQPVSAGNDNLPAVPLDPAAPKPTISISEATPASLTVALELGLEVVFAFGATNFVSNDLFEFNGQGPARIEIDPRLSNTNQFHEASSITKSAGTGSATLAFAATSDPSNTWNAKYKMECTAATDSSVKATVTVTRASNGLVLTAKVGGTAGNSLRFSMVDPGVPLSPLSVSFAGSTLTASLATDAAGAIISTYTQIAAAINALTSSPMSAVTTGVGSTVAQPTLTATADVVGASPQIINGIGTAFTAEVRIGTQLKLSNNGATVFTVTNVNATDITVTPSPANLAAATTLTGTAGVTNGSAIVSGGGGSLFTTEVTAGQLLKFASQPTKVYTVQTVDSNTQLTLTSLYDGATNAATTASEGFAVITVVSDPLATGANGAFTANVAWAEYGERVGVSGIASLSYTQGVSTNPTVTLSNGVVVTVQFSNGPLAVGDAFTWNVKAPREFYRNKDNRVVTITTDTVTNPSAGSGAVAASYVSDTVEGGFGTFTATDNAFLPSSSSWEHGAVTLAGNLLLYVRNMHGGPTTAASGNRHVATNKFTFSATVDGTINWSLVSKTTETIAVSSIATDVVGTITGTSATPYIILANIPDSILSVTDADSGTPLSYTLITASDGSNTQYISFVTRPTASVAVEYIYRGAEPTAGQVYYITSKHIRPDELYNEPILITSLDAGRRLLAPAEIGNHLHTMCEIAMGDVGAPGIYIVQVKDADGDGVFSDQDYKDAIVASEAPRAITDLIVLSRFSVLSAQLDSLNRMADPFKRRFRLGWIGAPVGTPIGTEDESGSLVHLSRRTLQVFGNNPAHGTRILVGSTSATRDVRLENNVVTEVTLDGSFVAGALAAMTAAFQDPADTLLRKSLPGFKTLQTYGDVESPNNLQLGANNIVFFTDQGASVFRIEEDVTVDTFAPDYNLINNMTQKMYVNKVIRDQVDAKLIGLVVPSAEAGVGLIRGFVLQNLIGLLGRGLIGAYQNDDGSERSIDGTKDVIVFRDASDPTLYHLLYAFYLRNEIKRVFGLFSVNSNNFGSGA